MRRFCDVHSKLVDQPGSNWALGSGNSSPPGEEQIGAIGCARRVHRGEVGLSEGDAGARGCGRESGDGIMKELHRDLPRNSELLA